MAGGTRFGSQWRASTRVPLLQVAKMALATVAAWLIAQLLLPGQLPVFAAIAALLVVAPSVNQSVSKAIERSLGVTLGVILAFLILQAFGVNSWVVIGGVVLSILLAWLLRLTPASAAQVPISVMLVLTIGATTPDYAWARIAETFIGAALGLVVNIAVVPPVLLAPSQDAITALAAESAATLERLADALRSPQTPAQLEELLITARLQRPMQAKAVEALKAANDSLAFNPRQQRYRTDLEGQEEMLARLAPIVTRSLNMTRAVHDHYDEALHDEPTLREIVDELDRAAHDLRLLAHVPVAPEREPSTTTAPVPLLTAPLRILTPSPLHWVLIGSLTEDLRRIHEEIVGSD